jgi:hypothetical protein
MYDKKLETIRHHFGIFKDTDWTSVRPEWITRMDGIGPATLNYVRMILAAKGLTLLDDRTPEYWKRHLPDVTICTTLRDPEEAGSDVGVMCPFTVVIDSAEQSPFTFQGLQTDADQGSRPLIVETKWQALGRHPDSLGDYSLDGYIGRCHVERKSMDDAHGTILGWGVRRDRFERELQNLSGLDAAMIVVECSLATLLANAPAFKRTAAQNQKALHRSIIAFQQDYRVPWVFCDSRRLAEQTTFRFLERYWRKQREAEKATEKEHRRANRRESADEILATI